MIISGEFQLTHWCDFVNKAMKFCSILEAPVKDRQILDARALNLSGVLFKAFQVYICIHTDTYDICGSHNNSSSSSSSSSSNDIL